MTDQKRVKITLYHAEWCGHCVQFMPTWKKMTSDVEANKSIEFESHEESVIPKLPENVRTFQGKDIRSNGFPTIRIKVDDVEYLYHGKRTPEEIYKTIVHELKKKAHLINNDVTVTQSENNISVSTENIHDSDPLHRQFGGNHKLKTANRLIRDSELVIE